MATPRRILAVFNPAAGGDRQVRFERIVTALRSHGCAVNVIQTTAPGHAQAIARDTPTSTYDVIVAAGGDGTVNEIVNGLTGKDAVLGLMPLGTANVLADEIGFNHNPADVARTLAFGPITTIRVGRANGRRFTMMAGVGFDANVVHGVSLALKKRIGPLAYVWQAIKQAASGGFEVCDVSIDGVAYRPTSIVVCKGRRYGGPFIAAPEANLADDRFHAIVMNGRGWLSVLRYGVALVMGRLAKLHDVQLVAGREVRVNSPAGQPVQADGDIIATLPVHITIDPEAVRLVVPG